MSTNNESGKAHCLPWADVPTETVVPGVVRQVVHGARQTMVRYVYAPGAVFPEHAHPHEQMTLVIRGRIAFHAAGMYLEMGPGEVAVIPGGVPHGAVVLGEDEVETFNALSPRREQAPNVVNPESTGD